MEKEFELYQVKCEKCKAIYYISWVEFDGDIEYCANCGDDEALESLETIKVREVK